MGIFGFGVMRASLVCFLVIVVFFLASAAARRGIKEGHLITGKPIRGHGTIRTHTANTARIFAVNTTSVTTSGGEMVTTTETKNGTTDVISSKPRERKTYNIASPGDQNAKGIKTSSRWPRQTQGIQKIISVIFICIIFKYLNKINGS